MSEVTALELRIHDNARDASDGLSMLAWTLGRLKEATSGLSLARVANGLAKINDALSKSVPEETVTRLERVAAAVEKLSAYNGIKIKLNGLTNGKNVNPASEIVNDTKKQIETQLNDAQNKAVETGRKIQDTANDAVSGNEKVAETVKGISKEYVYATEAVKELNIELGKIFKLDFSGTSRKPIEGTLGLTDQQKATIDAQMQALKQGPVEGSRAVYAMKDAVQSSISPVEILKNAFSALKTVVSAAGKALATAGRGISAFARGVAKISTGYIKILASGVKGVVGLVDKLKDRLDLSNTALGRLASGFKRIAFYRAIRAAIKMITEAVNEGIENLYYYSLQINGTFAAAMDTGASAALKFKNSIGAALGPAIEAIIPLLVQLSNVAIQAANAVNQFLSALFGRSTWTYAIDASTTAYEALKNAGGAAGDADKKVKGLLADWDELNIIQQESNKSGGGGGISAKEQDKLNAKDYFTTETLPVTRWTNMARDIRNAIASNDWEGVGKYLAEKLNGILDLFDPKTISEKLNDMINKALHIEIGFFTNFNFMTFGAKVGQILSGIFGNNNLMNWKLWGKLLKLKVEAAFGVLRGLFETEGLFADIGASLSATVNSFFDIDEELIGITLAEGLNGIAETVTSFLKLTEFEKIGKKIRGALLRFLAETDWFSVGSAVALGVTRIVDAVNVVVSDPATWEEIGTSFGQFTNGLFTVDESKLAETFVGGINGVVLATKSALTVMNFALLKLKLWSLLNQTVSGIDYASIGETFKSVLISAFTLATFAIAAPDIEGDTPLGKLGSGLAKAFNEAFVLNDQEINDVADSINLTIRGVFDLVKKFVGTDDEKDGVDWKGIGNTVGEFLKKIEWARIFEDVWLFVKGLLVGAFDFASGFIEAITETDRGDWGLVELTQDQINRFVKGHMFSIDVDTNIRIMSAIIEDTKAAKTKLNTRIAQLATEANSIVMGIDTQETYDNIWAMLFVGDDSVMALVKENSAKEKTFLKTSFALMPVFDESGNDITAETLAAGIEGWDQIEAAYTDLGGMISGYLEKGISLDEFEKELLTQLLGAVQRVNNAMSAAGEQNNLLSGLQFGLGVITKDSGKAIIDEYTKYKNELTKLAFETESRKAESYASLAAGFAQLAVEYSEIDATKAEEFMNKAEEYDAMAAEIQKGLVERVTSTVDEWVAPGRDWIIEGLKAVYKDISELPFETMIFKGNDMFSNYLISSAETLEDQALMIREKLLGFLEARGVSDASDLYEVLGLGFGEFTDIFLSDQAKQNIYLALKDLYGDVANDLYTLIFGQTLPTNVDTSTYNPVVQSAAENYIDNIFSAIEDYMNGNTDGLDFGMFFDKVLYNSVSGMLDTAGITDALDRTLIMSSFRNQLIEGFGKGFSGEGNTLSEIITAFMLEVSSYFAEHTPEIEDSLEGVTEAAEDALNPKDVTISGTFNNAAASVVKSCQQITSAIESMTNAASANFTVGITFTPIKGAYAEFASGGFPTVGEMFIARESGPEMVGTLSGKSAVANNDQIVAGISIGVANGQTEQNSLLRQQNDYLRQILAKESTVRVEPSAGWGKFNRRSEEMYARNAGV